MISVQASLVRFGLITLSLGCVITSSTWAARQVDLRKEAFPVLTEGRSLLSAAAPASSQLKFGKSHTDRRSHVTHIRVQQMHANYPVWGADAVVHLPANVNRNFMFSKNTRDFLYSVNTPGATKNGTYYADIDKDIGKTVPEKFLTEANKQAALATLKQSFLKTHKKDAWKNFDETAELQVYVDKKTQRAHWVYLTQFLTTSSSEVKQPTALIDADSKKIYLEWNNIKQAAYTKTESEPATAIGFGGNPLLGQWQYGKDKPALEVSRIVASDTCLLANEEVSVVKKSDPDLRFPGQDVSFDCAKKTPNQSQFEEPEHGFFGESNGAYSPLNDALHYGMIIKKMYRDVYNEQVLMDSFNEKPMQLSMNILYLPGGYQNAFWYSRQQKMYFGLGGRHLYPLVTLGIAAHEVTHGFTDQHSRLNYVNESGSINEAFSDMAIPVITHYVTEGKGTEWTVGTEVFKYNLDKNKEEWIAIRYLDEPTRDHVSIDKVSDLGKVKMFCRDEAKDEDGEFKEEEYQSCIVHLASGVFNKAFHRLAHSPSWDVNSAFGVMMSANKDYWTSNETFQSAFCGVKNAALVSKQTNRSLDLNAIDEAFKVVGIDVTQC